MKKKKRTTFLQLITKSGIVALAVSAIFSFAFHEALLISIYQSTYSASDELHTHLLTQINRKDNKYENPFPQIKHNMSLYSYCNVCLFDNGDYQLASEITENCHAVSLLLDECNNIVLSSRETLGAIIRFEQDEDATGYICDKDMLNNPQVDELYNAYHELAKHNSMTAWVRVEVDSAYVDRENYIFIPHECRLELKRAIDMKNAELFEEPMETVESREIKIDIDDDNYELITLEKDDVKAYPHIFIAGFHGTDTNFYDEHIADFNIGTGFHYIGDNFFTTSKASDIWIQGKKYTLYTACIIDEKAKVIVDFYTKVVVIFTLATLAIALLLSWYKNTKNKARYAFEDYQKTLINNLSHDLKTPLTAISGYAENALHSGEIAEITGYLDSICTNVLYMDSIVNRTLELNHLQEIKIKKENIDMIELAKKAIEKYSLMLEEKNITVEINGKCSFTTDKNTIETAVENLISNAVKYTHENGKIVVTAEKNSLTITNDITEQVDVKNLTMPFVKIDKARNEKSSGLGLTIVRNCADMNGLKFKISSTENKFTAILKK